MTPAPLLLRRTLVPLAVASAAAFAVAAGLAGRSSPGVEATFSFVVPLPPLEQRPASVSGGDRETSFEVLQAAELFAGTLTGWLSSADFAASSYARADIPFPKPTIRRLGRAFVAQRRGGQILDVRFRARSAEEARTLARAVAAELEERARTLDPGASERGFRVVASEPLVVAVSVSPSIRGLVAAIVLFVLGVNGVLLWDLLRGSPARMGD